ncbi:DUF454 domain-containing protein [Cohaesibacter celericrescens]|uniref:DUF454 domain-containing protein n=2 Tax=Cohaesibacter celericrescens TaxID=2067669 RepID=A0A2N5XT88_9HYPH|nr:DUF454 domain-containing protein [Cohaesibacter celericrescens]
MVLGLLVSGIGIIGAFLPVLPSTVFFIFAAFCFARSSPRLENWILNHSLFGPPVTAWQEHGAIPLMAKYFAFLGMAFGFGSFLYFVAPDLWLLVVVALFFIGSAVYVGSRPSGPRSE